MQQSPVAVPTLLAAPCQLLHEGSHHHLHDSWEQGSVTGTQQRDPHAKSIFLGWEIIEHPTGENTATRV